jgi:hypothetical protein
MNKKYAKKKKDNDSSQKVVCQSLSQVVYVQIKAGSPRQRKAASQVPATRQEQEQEQHGKAEIIQEQEHALNLKATSLLGPRFLCCGKIKPKNLCGNGIDR